MVLDGGQYLATGATLEPGLFTPQIHPLFLNSDFILIDHLSGGLQSSLFLSGCITEILFVFSNSPFLLYVFPNEFSLILSHQHRLVKNSCA
jgi:hypothetical protein